jgi:hypothetical protein
LDGIASIRSLSPIGSRVYVAWRELIVEAGIPWGTLGSRERLAAGRVGRGLGFNHALGSEGELLSRGLQLGTLFLETGWWLGEVVSDFLLLGTEVIVKRPRLFVEWLFGWNILSIVSALSER